MLRRRAVKRFWISVALIFAAGAIGFSMVEMGMTTIIFVGFLLVFVLDFPRCYRLYKESVEYGVPPLTAKGVVGVIAGVALAVVGGILIILALVMPAPSPTHHTTNYSPEYSIGA